MRKKYSFLYRNGLTIVLLVFFAGSMVGQVITGLHEYNAEREQHQTRTVSLSEYFATGHFYQTTLRISRVNSPESKPVDAANLENGSG